MVPALLRDYAPHETEQPWWSPRASGHQPVGESWIALAIVGSPPSDLRAASAVPRETSQSGETIRVSRETRAGPADGWRTRSRPGSTPGDPRVVAQPIGPEAHPISRIASFATARHIARESPRVPSPVRRGDRSAPATEQRRVTENRIATFHVKRRAPRTRRVPGRRHAPRRPDGRADSNEPARDRIASRTRTAPASADRPLCPRTGACHGHPIWSPTKSSIRVPRG